MAETATTHPTLTIDEQNEIIANAAKQLRIIPADGDGKQATEEKKEPTQQETVFTRTVKIGNQEKTYTGSSPEDVLNQVVAATEAFQLATPIKAAADEKKDIPALSDKDKIDYGIKIAAGDVAALDAYLVKSGILQTWLQAQGVTLDQVKNAVAATMSAQDQQRAASAAEAWLKTPGNDWPGGENNKYILGTMIGALHLDPTKQESFTTAYNEMKAKKLVLPVEKTDGGNGDGTKRKAAGSTSFATGAENNTRQTVQKGDTTISKAVWDKMSQAEQASTYNDLVAQGYKPENIKLV